MYFLSRSEIDTEKWNEVINQDVSGLPYAHSDILDACTDGRWNALVGEHYRWVLPLPFNRKLIGFKQFYQPYLLQQLGIFGQQPSKEDILLILKIIKKKSIRSLIAFQENNYSIILPFGTPKTNYVLDLKPGYDNIKKNYFRNVTGRLKKEYDDEWLTEKDISLDQMIDLYLRHSFAIYEQSEKLSATYIRQFIQSMDKLGMVGILALRAPDSTPYAGIIYLKTSSRIILSLTFNNRQYKGFNGPTRLIDFIIRQYAGQSIILDFEGSELPSVSEFYKSFGPEVKPYIVVSS